MEDVRQQIAWQEMLRKSARGTTGGCSLHESRFAACDPKLVQVEIPLSRLPEAWDGIRIAQVSDFHYDERFSVVPIRKAIDIVNGVKADFVALTGDFVTLPLFKNYFG